MVLLFISLLCFKARPGKARQGKARTEEEKFLWISWGVGLGVGGIYAKSIHAGRNFGTCVPRVKGKIIQKKKKSKSKY